MGYRCIYCSEPLRSDEPITVNAHNRKCKKYLSSTASGSSQKISSGLQQLKIQSKGFLSSLKTSQAAKAVRRPFTTKKSDSEKWETHAEDIQAKNVTDVRS